MNRRGIAPLAIFFEFEFFSLLFFVDGSGVVASFALRAGESDDVCHVEISSFHEIMKT